MRMWYLTVGCQSLLAVVFAASTAGKVRGRQTYADFRRSLPATVRIPAGLAGAVAATVVVAEAATTAALLAGMWLPGLALAGLASAGVLLAVFTVAVGSMIRRRVREPCRCRGGGRPAGPAHLARN
ncbi:MauE/DoxX family redox-associated membrane protein, partial [Plantactinospora endophytica]|uniref:MauE/DoxX family redox-associated membrane protein n=1 Tax=Plantactinospora endophytica TaxID=673535 RepID=UPI0036727C25